MVEIPDLRPQHGNHLQQLLIGPLDHRRVEIEHADYGDTSGFTARGVRMSDEHVVFIAVVVDDARAQCGTAGIDCRLELPDESFEQCTAARVFDVFEVVQG